MSLSTPIAPITLPSASRSAEALSVVGMTSPVAARGFRTALRVTPRSTTSRRAAVNSRVSSSLMNRDSDCSTTSSWRKPSSCEIASFAWRILPSRSETNTGSGAFLMMMSATRTSRAAAPALPLPSVRASSGGFMPFLATAVLRDRAMPGRCVLILRVPVAAGNPGSSKSDDALRRSHWDARLRTRTFVIEDRRIYVVGNRIRRALLFRPAGHARGDDPQEGPLGDVHHRDLPPALLAHRGGAPAESAGGCVAPALPLQEAPR